MSVDVTYYELADLPELSEPVKREPPKDPAVARARALHALSFAYAASQEARRRRREATIQEVAYLRHTLGMSYDRIAEDLGMKRNSLARSFERWRKLGYTSAKFPYASPKERRLHR